jgi:hypothetical protein
MRAWERVAEEDEDDDILRSFAVFKLRYGH